MIVNPMQYGTQLPTLETPGTAADLLSPKQLIDGDGNVVDGTIETRSLNNISFYDGSVLVTAGYYPVKYGKTIPTGTLATPNISVDPYGTITATVTQTSSGYLRSGTSKAAQYYLPTQAAQTITPGTGIQVIAKGTYLTGAQAILGDANLVPENIRAGVTIFGVTGTYDGSEV